MGSETGLGGEAGFGGVVPLGDFYGEYVLLIA